MSDTSKRTRMSLREIDRLLADSPMPTPHRVGGISGATSRPLPRIMITDEDLALLDETEMEERSSAAAALSTTINEETTERITRIADVFSAGRATTPPSSPTVAGTSDKQTERTPICETLELITNADRISLSEAEYSPPLYSPNKSTEEQTGNRRSSLSRLAYGWSTMMGHPIAGSVAEELAAQQHPAPAFSPLLTQSSKLITDMVSSLLSPWSTASRRLREQARLSSSNIVEETPSAMGDNNGEAPVLGDKSFEESLINAFGKIAVADDCSSEREEVFFSPTRERNSTDSQRDSFIRSVNVTLKSTMMEDTCCEATFISETSHYSDAISALPSPLRSFKPSDQQQASHSLDKPVQQGISCLSLGEFIGEHTEAPTKDIDLTPIGAVSRRTLLKEDEDEGTALDNQRHLTSLVSPLTPAKAIEEKEKVICHTKETDMSNVENNPVKEIFFVSPKRTAKNKTSQCFDTNSGQQSQLVSVSLDQQCYHPGVGITNEIMAKEALGASKHESMIPEFRHVDATGCTGTEFPGAHVTSGEEVVGEEPDQYSPQELPGPISEVTSEDVQNSFVERSEEHNILASKESEQIMFEDNDVSEDTQENSVERLEPYLLVGVQPLRAEEAIQHDLFSSPALPVVRALPLPAAGASEQQPEQFSKRETSETGALEISATGHLETGVFGRLSSHGVLTGAHNFPLESIESPHVCGLSEVKTLAFSAIEPRSDKVEVSQQLKSHSHNTALCEHGISIAHSEILEDSIESGEPSIELLESVVPDVPEYIQVEVPGHHKLHSVEELPGIDIAPISDVILSDQRRDQIELCTRPALPQAVSAQLEEISACVQQSELLLESSKHPKFYVSHTSPEAEILAVPGVFSGEIKLEDFGRSELPKARVSIVSGDLQVVSGPQESQISGELQVDISHAQKCPDAEVLPVPTITSESIHMKISEQLQLSKVLVSSDSENAQVAPELQEHNIPHDISGVGISMEDVQMRVSYLANDLPKSRVSTALAELSELQSNVSTVGAPVHPNITGEASEHSQNLSEPGVLVVPNSIAVDFSRVDVVITEEPLLKVYEQPKRESLTEVAPVIPSSLMDIKSAEEAIAQNNSAIELEHGVSDHSTITTDSDSEPISKRTQATDSHEPPMGPFAKEIDDKIPASPCPSGMSIVEDDPDDWNRSRRFMKSTSSQGSSFRRDSTGNSMNFRKSLPIVEETGCSIKESSSRRSIETSLSGTTGRRRTITLEKPSPHLQASLTRSGELEGTLPVIRRSCVPGSRHSSKTALNDLAGSDDKQQTSSPSLKCLLIEEDVNQISDAVESTELGQEDKENVAPEVHSIVTNHRATHRLLMPSAAAQARRKSPKMPPTSHQEQSETEEPVEEEKARLHEEVWALREREDVLKLILARYRSTFEEALDNQSRMHFATASAGAQADQETHDARRQAATLHSAVLESQKRQERIREEIERRKMNQEQIIKRTEALEEKYLRLLEKGQTYQKYCLNKIQRAVENLEKTNTELDKEVSRLRVQLKQLELKQKSLEANLEQKGKENEELTKICDNLLKGVL